MHIHILGICGTFMGGLALLARRLGHTVTGSDLNVYPPMSTQLAEAGIELFEGWDPGQLEPAPDLVLIGNALSRGNPAVEDVLNRGLAYTSGAEWLRDHVLAGRWVLACAGTHGKTTTTSMLAWILEACGYEPGFLVGGIPANFGRSARLTDSSFFVLEADEYDTAFFDKRSKFVHYRPRTLILNNLEFDHGDIFDDLHTIKRQFHHLVRTVPGAGRIIHNASDAELDAVIDMGCWTPRTPFDSPHGWHARALSPDCSRLDIRYGDEPAGELAWSQKGAHNAANACAAIAAAEQAGVAPAAAIRSLAGFQGVKRRLELRGKPRSIADYDDFDHHPTAIRTTLDGLAASVENSRIL